MDKEARPRTSSGIYLPYVVGRTQKSSSPTIQALVQHGDIDFGATLRRATAASLGRTVVDGLGRGILPCVQTLVFLETEEKRNNSVFVPTFGNTWEGDEFFYSPHLTQDTPGEVLPMEKSEKKTSTISKYVSKDYSSCSQT